MTVKKDLKKRIRERQEKTGEAYTTARMHVLDEAPAKPSGVSQLSLREVTPLLAELGLKGEAFLSPRFPEALARPALERLREVLLATEGDPDTKRMRAVLLRGERDTFDVGSVFQEWTWAQGFVTKLRLGVRGPSKSGRILTFDLPAEGGPVALVAALIPSMKASKLLLATADDFLRAEEALRNPAALLQPFTVPEAE